VPFPLATQLQIANWQAEEGGKLKVGLPVEMDLRRLLEFLAPEV
jgi:hypothetical protein